MEGTHPAFIRLMRTSCKSHKRHLLTSVAGSEGYVWFDNGQDAYSLV